MLKIVINSTYSFYEKSLNILLPSLIEAGAKKERIEVVIGASPFEYKREIIDSVNYNFVNYDSVDLTSFICLIEHPEILNNYQKFLYIHDTTKAGKNFFVNMAKKLIYLENKPKEELQCIKLASDGASMNIGIYNTAYILDPNKKDYALSLKNFDFSPNGKLKAKEVAFKHEDFYLKNNAKYALNDGVRINSKIPNPYGEKALRLQEYYPNLDLYKFKANGSHTIGIGLPPVMTL